MAAGGSFRRNSSSWAPIPEPQSGRTTIDSGLRLVEWCLSGLIVIVMVVLIGLPAWTQAADALPTLTLSPASGTAGTLVTVTGSNFGRTTVQLMWDGSATDMPSVNATGNGSFRATFTVRPSTTGTHEVRASTTSDARPGNGNKKPPTTAAASATFVLAAVAVATPVPAPTTTATAAPSPSPTVAPIATPVPTVAPAPTAVPTAAPTATATAAAAVSPWSVPFLGRTPSGQIWISGKSNLVISGFAFQNLATDAIVIENSSNITITENDFANVVGGIYVHNSTNVRVTWNRYRNIGDGTIGSGHSNFVQFANTTDGYIGHNKGVGGNTEDIISMWQSGGSSSSSPLVIEYNQFEGTTWTSGSGSGIMLGDGGGSHVIARFNTLLNPGQVGIAISSGTDNHITDNIIYGAMRASSNVGSFVWNQYPTSCSAIEVARNQVKWYRYDGVENPTWDGGNCGTITGMWTTNNWHAALDPNTMHVVL